MKKDVLLIFDFDGTIADTKQLYYEAIYKELKSFGFSYKDADRAIDFGTSLRKTLKKMGFSFLISWFLHKRILKEIKKHIGEIKKCKDASSIQKIKGEKILVTNSLKEFAVPVLKHLKLKKCFKKIYGADDFSDKAEFIKKYLKQRKAEKKECFYVGDRVADVKLARKAGCNSVIIAGKCAWDSRKELAKAKPDFIIDDLKELGRITW